MGKFTRLGPNGVRSSDGYEVEIAEPYGLIYREAKGRFVDLYRAPSISFDTGESYWRIHLAHHLAWNSHVKLLTDSDRSRIRKRVHSALKLMKHRHEFR
jgi:hypothetical protein